MSTAECDFDVLVLGAGVAGLEAALQLALAGRRVALIEARGRVGGRIHTRHAPLLDTSTTPVELGAEFIHGLPPESWRHVRAAGLETDELDGSQLRFADGRLQSMPHGAGPWRVLEDMMRWFKAQPPGTDETFEHYMTDGHGQGADPSSRNDAIRYVEGFNAADHRLIGVAALARQQAAEDAIDADRLFHVRAGYEALPHYLRRTFESAAGRLFLDRPVASVEWREGAVTMSGMDTSGRKFEYRGAQAIITLPLGVLQAGTVAFDPAPHTALDAARCMAMGSVVRVPLIFRTPFWKSASTRSRFPHLTGLNDLSFLFTDHAVPATWWTPNPSTAPMLVAWIAGPGAASLDRGTLLDTCLSTLAGIFGMSPAELAPLLLSWHFHDWDADPCSKGSYSYMPAGALDASRRMAEPVRNTLYFAGEHTTVSGHWGTVHGALHSGEAAAAALLKTHASPTNPNQ